MLLILSAVPGCDAADERDDTDRKEATDRVTLASEVTAVARQTPLEDESLFPSDRIIDVDLTLSQADWDTIRAEGRSTNEVYSGCLDPKFEYTTVPASARIDGENAGHVGVRKKGFLGSLSALKPSLRLDFNAFDRRTFRGRKDLTLNNSRSDSSLVHQCLAYSLFGSAGIPSPRCGFARVSQNGRELGLYVNVEPMKKPFLRRYFRDPDGDLYEGSLHADFRPPNLARFEKKTNERDLDFSALRRVTEALEGDDAGLVARLEPLVDLDQFFRFWAMETLTGHYNGYTGSLNNFMMYGDPSRGGRLVFLPWGTDGAFSRSNTYLPSAGARPVATSAWARLPGRLYAHEPTRRRYQAALRALLDTVWNEPAINAEIDRMVALLGTGARADAIASLRRFVAGRRATIESELAAPDQPWTLGDRPFAFCTPEKNTALRATFATQWNAVAASNPDTTLTLSLDGQPQQFTSVRVSIGSRVRSSGAIEPPNLSLVGQLADGTNAAVSFDLSAAPPRGPGTIALHGFETSGSVYTWRGESSSRFVGYVGKGTIVLEQASMEPGAVVTGRIEATFLQTRTRAFAPEPAPTPTPAAVVEPAPAPGVEPALVETPVVELEPAPVLAPAL